MTGLLLWVAALVVGAVALTYALRREHDRLDRQAALDRLVAFGLKASDLAVRLAALVPTVQAAARTLQETRAILAAAFGPREPHP